MRAPVRIPDGDEVARLAERVPAKPVNEDDSIAPGLPVPNTDERAKFRTEGQRDRDRILYSSHFQRLGGVTQVTESEVGHTFHTRLTHSLKVAQIARRCAEKLHQQVRAAQLVGRAAQLIETIDLDATEAAALAHDLGHPPFGHVAEETLKKESLASFEGNAQSFRIVNRLSIRETEPGLSLTRQTLNGILKYPWLRDAEVPERENKWGAYDSDKDAFLWVRRDTQGAERSPIAELMDWADDVTYAVHDLDDFYRAGLVPIHQLAEGGKELDRFRDGLARAGRDDPDAMIEAVEPALGYYDLSEPYEGRDDQRAALHSSASALITQYLDAFLVEEGDQEGRAVIVIDDEARRQVTALKDLTWVYVVMRPSLAVMQAGRRRVIGSLYKWYFEATAEDGDRRLLPRACLDQLEAGATDTMRSRLATDLVSGLTEAAALELYRRMSGVDPGSILDAAARVG